MTGFEQVFNGLCYTWSWCSSIIGGYLLFAPLLLFQFFSPKVHRYFLDLVLTYWQYYVTVVLARHGCQVHVFGDAIQSDEVSIVISNHRTRVDWNFLWAVMYHAVRGKNRFWLSTKFILKKSISRYPGVGWVMQMVKYIFIERNWEKDKETLDDYMEYVYDMDYKHILVLFPEGTDLTPRTIQNSDKFAQSNGLKKYKHVLHPRSTGFVYLVDEMRKRSCLNAVYDVTLIYPDTCPQSEDEIFLQGKMPETVKAYLTRYPVETLPETTEGLKEFLEQRWSEKEDTIEKFGRTGRFPGPGKLLNRAGNLTDFWGTFTYVVWAIGTGGLFCLLALSPIYLLSVLLHTAGLYVIPGLTDLSVYKIWKVFQKCIRKLKRR